MLICIKYKSLSKTKVKNGSIIPIPIISNKAARIVIKNNIDPLNKRDLGIIDPKKINWLKSFIVFLLKVFIINSLHMNVVIKLNIK